MSDKINTKPNCCKKCGSIALHTETKGNNTGLYCNDCGAWIKWLNKDELRAFSFQKNEIENNEDIINRLQEFVDFLDKNIDSSMSKEPISPADSIRKSSYCLALERSKNSIMSIINGKHYFDYDEV